MNRTLALTATLAAAFAAAPPLLAQGPGGANCPPGGYAAGATYGGHGAPGPRYIDGCAFCFKFLGGLHQHGPLFNYGPYEGYYPFAPYGPWNGPYNYQSGSGGNGNCGQSACGWNRSPFGHLRGGNCAGGKCGLGGGCGAGGCNSGLGGLSLGGLTSRFGGGGCSSGSCGSSSAWGGYASSTFGNVFRRSHPLAHRAKLSTGSSFAPASGCGNCGGSTVASTETGAALQSVSAEGVGEAGNGQFRRER